jgi:hypothetical protein
LPEINNFDYFPDLVPRQCNYYDCGLYTCRFAYTVYKLRKVSFNYCDVLERPSLWTKIKKSSLFNFDDSEIFEFRSQLGQLIDNLSNVYRLPPIQGNLDVITIDYDGNTYGSPSQLTNHVEPSLDELKVAAKVESPIAEV